MNNALNRTCFALWILGTAGMCLTKGLQPVGELPFAISARMSVVGAGSLVFLLALDLIARARSGE
jgi:hypothetical protein